MNRSEYQQPIAARFVSLILRSGLRGRTRLTLLLAKTLKSLQAVPLQFEGFEGLAPLYADLRVITAHEMLLGTMPEESEQQVIRRLLSEGDVVWDVGAYMGYHSLLFSHLVGDTGKVCSFEPNQELLLCLARTLERLRNVTLYSFGLAETTRIASLIIPEDPSMSSLKDWTEGAGGETHQLPIELHRLDDLVANGTLPLPDFIKCDVEGAETSVFRGGREAINRIAAPLVLFEANAKSASAFGESVSSAMEFLSGLPLPQYSFFEIREGGKVARIDRPNPQHSNILAVPDSRLELMAFTASAS